MACLAENTGGRYFPANDADQLANALEHAVAFKKPEPVKPSRPEKVIIISNLSLIEGGAPLNTTRPDGVKWSIEGPLDANGKGPKILAPAGRKGGLYHKLAQGKYRYSVKYKFGGYAEKVIETGIEKEQQEIIPINAARIEAFADFPSANDDTKTLASIRWQLKHVQSEKIAIGVGHKFDFYVPAGDYVLSIKPPRGKFEELSPIKISAKKGKVAPASIVLPHSKITVMAVEPDGSVNKKIRYNIRKSKTDGSLGEYHRNMPGTTPVYALPGSYILVVEAWDGTKRKVRQPIEIGFSDVMNVKVKLP